MINTLNFSFLIGLISLMSFTVKAQNTNNLGLWYDKPASEWMTFLFLSKTKTIKER
jgi:hypothetical protein